MSQNPYLEYAQSFRQLRSAKTSLPFEHAESLFKRNWRRMPPWLSFFLPTRTTSA